MKEKQIEEMARELNTATFGVNVHTLADHLKPETINKVAEYLYNAGYRKQSEWISVEERLPRDIGEYIVMINGAVVPTTLWYDPWENDWYEGDDKYYVTHWMPLPEAPKKGGAE